MLDIILYIWFALVAVSVIYVAWDAFRHNPEMTVMKWGWLLVTLFTGPVGMIAYILSCKEPSPGQHEQFIKPLWKQGLGSQIHCLAGDGTGIVVTAAITAAIGFPMWLDVTLEYIFGFLFGLTIFQALFMKDMLGGSYTKALKSAFMPEWLSMNAVMAAMIPVMVLLMDADMASMEPNTVGFWGIMSLAFIVAGIVAYPVNVWLVVKGFKHGMGTVRVLGKGGHSLEAEKRAAAEKFKQAFAPSGKALPEMAGMKGM